MEFLNRLNRLGARAVFALLAVVAGGLVGVGLAIGELMHINPCPLCIFQRVLYLALAAVALCGALAPALRRLWGGLLGLIAAGGLATALYQSWMQFYPEAVTQCGFGEPTLIERLVDWLGMQWLDGQLVRLLFRGLPACRRLGRLASARLIWRPRPAVDFLQDFPVLPKPPAPRALASKLSTTLNATCSTGTTTN